MVGAGLGYPIGMRDTEFRQFDSMTPKLLAASAILGRNPFDLKEEISEIIIDCDGDSEGYHSPVFAEPNEMGLREILLFFRFTPQVKFIRKFLEF